MTASSSTEYTSDVAVESDDETILSVKNLQTAFFTDKEVIRAVDGVSFDIERGETVGIVGESGSGKSVTARSIMGLVDTPGRILEGSSIEFTDLYTVRELAANYPGQTLDLTERAAELDELLADDANDIETREQAIEALTDDEFVFVEERRDDEITGGYVDLARAPEEALRSVRGGDIAMVFQDPLTSLNPVYTVGNQIKEAVELHQNLSGAEATEKAVELLEAVGIPDANRRLKEYPHQFSGGMRQRAVIAMALACDPELLICDEPTTALDVTIQAQILELLQNLQDEHGLSIMFITHDMGVIAEVSDRVNVMYAGEVVESASAVDVFENPRHPYTQGLLESIPGRNASERLTTIEGEVPTPNEPATYCRFAPRCPKEFEDCTAMHPASVAVNADADDHTARCLLYPEDVTQEQAIETHRELGAKENERRGETDE